MLATRSSTATGLRRSPTDLTLDGAYRAVSDYLSRGVPIDGLVIGTYGQSSAVVRAVTDAGRRVPDDLAIVTFDGDPRNSYAPVVLSAVQQRVDTIAETALMLALHPTTRTRTRTPNLFRYR